MCYVKVSVPWILVSVFLVLVSMKKAKANYSKTPLYTPTEGIGFIYCTTNLINGKKYIGSKLMRGRKPQYYLGTSYVLKSAIDKYGIHNFKRDILEVIYNEEDIFEAEDYWLNYYPTKSSSLFYNIKNAGSGGDTFSGRSKESKSITRTLLRESALRNNLVARINSPEILEMNRQRLLTNNPTANKTTEQMILAHPNSQSVVIEFEDGSKQNYLSIKSAARAIGKPESSLKFRYRNNLNKMLRGWKITKLK